MNTAAIEIKYVNPKKPEGRSASVKDANGDLWLVPPADIGQFTPGMKCTVEYEANTNAGTGKTWKTIKRIVSNGNAPQVPSQNYRQRSNPAEARQIAVLAMAKSWLDKIPPGDEEAAVHAIGVLMRVYDRTLGGTQAQRRDDMDDNIPY